MVKRKTLKSIDVFHFSLWLTFEYFIDHVKLAIREWELKHCECKKRSIVTTDYDQSKLYHSWVRYSKHIIQQAEYEENVTQLIVYLDQKGMLSTLSSNSLNDSLVNYHYHSFCRTNLECSF